MASLFFKGIYIMLRKLILIVVLSLTSFVGVMAQNDSLSFTNIDVIDGLSNNSVTCLTQDKYGFMWMGTYDGLNRYDGYEFKVFRNKWQDTTSLINNHVVALKRYDSTLIWVGTLKGVSLFDYSSLSFRNVYYMALQNKHPEVVRSRVREIEVDKGGNTYIATEDDGLLYLQKGAAVFKQVAFENEGSYNVAAICGFTNGNLLLYIKNKGLYTFDPLHSTFAPLLSNINDVTRLLYLDKQNTILIGSENGLSQYNLSTRELSPLHPALSNSNITNLFQDDQDNIWISTDGDGLAKFDSKSRQLTFYKQGLKSSSLKSDAVYAVYEDKGKRKWIATLRGGVSIMDTLPNLFTTVRVDPFSKNTLTSNFALSFCEDDKDNIWIGTDGGGLSYWNPKTNIFTNYTHSSSNPQSISGNYIVSIIEDDKKRIWIASFSGGIDRFDPSTRSFIHYACYNPVRQKNDINLWKLYEDSYHHIWAGSTKDDALFLFNESKNAFELFDNSLTNIHTLFEDSKGNLWAGNYDQLIKIDTLYKKHTYISIGYPVRAIIEDKEHQLWIGSEGGGLILLNGDRSLKHYTVNDGLPSNSILNILEDADGYLWCSTYNGLFKFDPQKRTSTNFSANDGLQSNQFNYNAALKLRDGELLFGGVNGFNKFFPERITKTVVHPPVYITDFKINDISIQNTPYLPKGSTPVNLQSLVVPFNQASLSIAFAGLDYAAPGSIVYSYYLEGWDKGWNMAGKTRVANYSRLYEGDYTLHIRATNTDGSWNGNERIVHIRVLPPWYRSWWAYLLYILAFASAVYIYLKYKQRQTRLEYEVKLTRMNAEAEKELTERKIAFFTNISHEFRTMLTLIINPMKELMKHANENEKPEEIRTAYKNSRRMLSLVTQLLMFRKADVEEAEMMVSKIDLVHIVREVFDSFAYQAKTKGLQYTFVCDRDSIEIYGDYEKLEIVLFNLLSNAVKYAPEKGKVEVTLKEDNKQAYISISDNGHGIPKADQERVFRKYHQAHSMESSVRPGFGIGLFLVKNYIDRHHGHISLQSEENQGTTFYIELLKGKDHFAGIPIRESKKLDHGLLDDILPEDDSEEDQAVVEENSVKPALVSGDKTILLADDDKEIRSYVRKLFTSDGYKIIEADNGINALELVRKNLPDLAILDLTMPGMYGDELCQSIKSDDATSHIPVIMLTAEISSETKLRCVESGADDYITKPFEKELLMARVNNLLKVKNNLQNYFFNQITLQENTQQISAEDKAFLDKCIEYVEQLENETIDVKKMADALFMSHSSLYKKIHNISGYSVNGFVRFVRLRKAAELFINSTLNITETASSVGFNDIKYFRTQFTKLFGMTPSAYVKKYRKPFQKSYKMDPPADKA